jgi:predicted small integral membrane protein
METLTNFKNKSFLEKIAPFVLIIGVIILGYFLWSKFEPTTTNKVGQTNTVTTTQVQVDTDFLMSEAFTKLRFVPDSPIFNEVTGDVPSGKEDPFAQ